MHSLKWLVLITLALLCCACAKNDPLAYVDEDAEWVIYGNLEEILEHRLWDKIQNQIQNYDDVEQFVEVLEKSIEATPDECSAKFALWGQLDKWGTHKEVTCVIVLKDLDADDVIRKYTKFWEKDVGGNVKKTTVGNCPAYKFYRTYYFYRNKKEEYLQFSIARIDEKIIQVFFQAEPESIAKPTNKSKLAKQIDNDCIAGIAVDGDLIRGRLKEKFPGFKTPKVGDAVVMLFADDDQIKIEGTVDISNID